MIIGRISLPGFALALAALAAPAAPLHAHDNQAVSRPYAVIELFTSQGCSSCPAADAVLAELKNRPDIIALSYAVDYWDYLGWKDTLAMPQSSARQRAYSRARGDRNVFTPQVVVNGKISALGSDRDHIARAIETSRQDIHVLSVPVTLKIEGDTLSAILPDHKLGTQQPFEVWACAITHEVPVSVGHGENQHRTLRYHNIVRRMVKIGTWTGKAGTVQIPLADIGLSRSAKTATEPAPAPPQPDAAVVYVQAGSFDAPRMIVGAASIRLN